jgi:hypothetical protein
MIYKTVTFTCVAIAAVGPVLHGHPAQDCNRRVELCHVSDALYLPDDPAPEPSPLLISDGQLTVAASTATVTGSSLARSLWLSDSHPPRWRPLPLDR